MNILLCRLLAELGQNAFRALRMQERNHQVLSSFARSFVDQLDACCLALCQRFGYVLHVESHVVNTTATTVLLDELSNCGLRARRLQKLDLHFSNFEESGANLLILNYLD